MRSRSSIQIAGTDQIADGAVTNAKVNAAAAIAMSKLSLAITNTEVAAGAAIARSKLASSTSLFTPLAPTFTGFTTNPGTAAELAHELGVALSTAGVIPSNTICQITYDLSASKRVVVGGMLRLAAGSWNACDLSASDDGVTYFAVAAGLASNIETGLIDAQVNGIVKARYIRFTMRQNTGGTQNITHASLRALEV